MAVTLLFSGLTPHWAAPAHAAAAGSLDTTFNPGPGANDPVHAIAIQSDGKILIGGQFTCVGSSASPCPSGNRRNRIARLNANGSHDTSFNPRTGAENNVNAIAIQSDSKILIGGGFTSVGGQARSRIARLDANGSLDTSFDPNASSAVNAIAIDNDGKILIGGGFSKVRGVDRNRIARLNPDGSLDTSFNPNANGNVSAIAIQSDGKILIGGEFTTLGSATARPRIARLNADGTPDTSFNPGSGANDIVRAIAIQSDGKILIGGAFTKVGGVDRNRIARLNNDGTLDTSFDPGTGADKNVNAIAIQGDGMIIIGGEFRQVNSNSNNRDRIARLTTSGSLDAGFNPNASGSTGHVNAIEIQSDGKILIGGDFTRVGGTGADNQRNRIARLNPGTPPTPAPTIDVVSPASGSTAGGTTVTITGSNLANVSAVTFGGAAATLVTVNGEGTSITADTPARTAGTVDVAVTTPGGTATKADAFTYVTVPSAPLITEVTAGNGQVSVAFTAPADGGTAIQNYQYATKKNGGEWTTWTARAPPATTSPLVITGLTNGTEYQVRIRAVNSAGEGAASEVSTGTPRAELVFSTGYSSVQLVTDATMSSQTPVVDGGLGARSFAVSPPLPAGMSLDTTTGVLSGTPSATSPTVTYTVTVTDATTGQTATSTFDITVQPPMAFTAGYSNVSQNVNTVVASQTPTVSNGYGTKTFAIEPALPTGMTFYTSTGAIGGTPTVGQTTATTHTVTVTDAASPTSFTATTSFTVQIFTTPDPPTGVTGTPGNTQVTVSWTAPVNDGGSSITGYTVIATPGGASCTVGTPLPDPLACDVTGLTNGIAHTFTVTATNGVDTGSASVASGAVTPVAEGLAPAFDTPLRTAGGFTVNVTNYDASYEWVPTVSSGTVTPGEASDAILPLTVTGLEPGASATITVTTSATGFTDDSATVEGRAKSTQTVTWAPELILTLPGKGVIPSSATAEGGATIEYSLKSAGSTGCSVDKTSGAITYSSVGDCTIEARALPTADYLEATKDVTFTVSEATQSVTWAPTTAVTTVQSPLTPSVLASALGGAPITYVVQEDGGSAGCTWDSEAAKLIYTSAGTCTVRATAAATVDYLEGFVEVEFSVSKATPTLTWAPSTEFTVPDGSTTFATATTDSDGVVSYSLTSNTAGCTLVGRKLSFTQEGSCGVTASVSATDTYDAITPVVKTFAISKAAQTITWSPSTSLNLSSLSALLGGATTTGDGAMSYSATSSGSENCRFPASTSPDLHYDADGTCTVTATAASTVSFAQATESVIIRITKATPTLSWTPATALTMPAATVSPTAATSSGDGPITYARTSGSNCEVDTNTGTLTYTATGNCQITATSAATTRFTAGSTAVTFTVSLASQSITASASSMSLRPRETASLATAGTSGGGAITWASADTGICTVSGSTVTALADGSCVLTASIAADDNYAGASATITITITTPSGGGGSGGGGSGGSGSGGGSSGGGSSGGSSSGTGTGGSSEAGAASSGASSGAAPGAVQSQDEVVVPGSGTATRGRALPPPPEGVEVRPVRGGARSSVLVQQPAGTVGSQVLATVVVVRNAQGRVISRINVTLTSGQAKVEVSVPFVAEGYTVDVYNVNQVGVSTGALMRSPLVRATTITKRGADRQPSLFGATLGRPIIFTGGSAALSARAKRQLNAIARGANARGERLFVTGFARKGGGSQGELASLSTRRANAAAQYLSRRGVRVWIRYWGAGSLNGTGSISDRRVEVRTSANRIPRTLVP